jgi:hypothetical protein
MEVRGDRSIILEWLWGECSVRRWKELVQTVCVVVCGTSGIGSSNCTVTEIISTTKVTQRQIKWNRDHERRAEDSVSWTKKFRWQ